MDWTTILQDYGINLGMIIILGIVVQKLFGKIITNYNRLLEIYERRLVEAKNDFKEHIEKTEAVFENRLNEYKELTGDKMNILETALIETKTERKADKEEFEKWKKDDKQEVFGILEKFGLQIETLNNTIKEL